MMLTTCTGFVHVQAVEELKKKLQGLKELYLAQLQSFHTAVHAHEAVSTSTFKTLECTVAAHPAALEKVCISECRCRGSGVGSRNRRSRRWLIWFLVRFISWICVGNLSNGVCF